MYARPNDNALFSPARSPPVYFRPTLNCRGVCGSDLHKSVFPPLKQKREKKNSVARRWRKYDRRYGEGFRGKKKEREKSVCARAHHVASCKGNN